MSKMKIKDMAFIAILGAIANILLLIRFPLPFMPPFMDFDLSGFPEIIGTFMMGPAAGVMIVVVKILLKIVMTGSNSMFTGEIQNVLLSCAYIIPAGIIYRIWGTKKSALTGMIVGTIVCAIIGIFSNMYLIIPFYTKVYHMSMEDIISMTQAVNRWIDSEWKFVVLGVLPFNLIKGMINTVVIWAVLPMLSIIIKQTDRSVS